MPASVTLGSRERYSDKDSISAVVFWSTTDDMSWRASKYPLLFNEDYTAKPCFYSIIDGIEPTEETSTEANVSVRGDVNADGASQSFS